MPALIDYYSAPPAQSISACSVVSFRGHCIEERRPYMASVVLAYPVYPGEINLNSKIMHLLNEYATLQDNWDEDGAKSPTLEAIINAKSITTLLTKHGQQIFHTAPGPNGEIMMDVRNKNKNRSIEIILYQQKSIAVLFPEQGNAAQQNFNTSDLPVLLNWLNKK